tara:strand:- start:6 stop:224 length:219 start_codon:yes stop_codon:yes gene_type:complete
MTYQQFLALSESNRIKAMNRALKASSNLDNKINLPTQKDVETLHCCIKWLGGEKIVKSWEKRVFNKAGPAAS